MDFLFRMSIETKILGVIPARGGSKGIKNKNIKTIFGKPLIAWSIEIAQKSKLLSGFLVSTEDKEITKIATSYGANVLTRPKHLATDEATTLSLLQHVIREISIDIVVVLQPTSPIRSESLIDQCITRFIDKSADCLATGYYCKSKEYGTHNNRRRQDTKGFFYDDGNIYIMKKELIEAGEWAGGTMERFELVGSENYEIDNDLDFFIVEKLLERQLKNKALNL